MSEGFHRWDKIGRMQLVRFLNWKSDLKKKIIFQDLLESELTASNDSLSENSNAKVSLIALLLEYENCNNVMFLLLCSLTHKTSELQNTKYVLCEYVILFKGSNRYV